MATPATVRYVARIGFIDHAEKTSSISFEISATDYGTWLTDTSTGAVRDLFNAYEAMSLDNVTSEVCEKEAAQLSSFTIPTSEDAVNSAKLLVLETDTVTAEKYRNYIPARKASAFNSSRGAVIITGADETAEVTALIAAIQASQLSEDGNALEVRGIRVVGRGTGA